MKWQYHAQSEKITYKDGIKSRKKTCEHRVYTHWCSAWQWTKQRYDLEFEGRRKRMIPPSPPPPQFLENKLLQQYIRKRSLKRFTTANKRCIEEHLLKG